ncbi:MAG: polysaccharide pyruvyl transferase family protein [Planctomycetaceae bacterium]|nr:polysaccharide pyruvyl transferase family protein [Planctomycetaceae bacterium]
MRGLVLGYYNQRNAGDDRLESCIRNWLSDHELIFRPHMEVPEISQLDQVDYVLIGGGSVANRVGGVFFRMRNWINKARIPVFCAGIGVSDFQEFQQEMSVIRESGGHIWVRDPESLRNVRQPVTAVDLAPDLSWLYPMHFPSCRRHGTAINLRPGGVRQIDIEQWRGAFKNVESPWAWPLCFGKEDDRDVIHHIATCDGISEFDPTGASRAELVIAMRFHAVIFAIQAGTPVVPIVHTKKTQFLLEQAGLTDLMVAHDQPELLGSAIERAQTMDRSRLSAVCERMHHEVSEYAQNFKTRIEDAVQKNEQRRAFSYRVRRRLRNQLQKMI